MARTVLRFAGFRISSAAFTMGRRYLSVAIAERQYYNGTPLPISRPVSVPMAVSPTSSTCAVKDGDDGTEERPAKRVR
jgi:hypothetical protein